MRGECIDHRDETVAQDEGHRREGEVARKANRIVCVCNQEALYKLAARYTQQPLLARNRAKLARSACGPRLFVCGIARHVQIKKDVCFVGHHSDSAYMAIADHPWRDNK